MTPELADAAVKACLEALTEQLVEAASLAKAVKGCTDAGNVDAAFKITLDIEPLLHDADHLIQAASTVRRRGCPHE